MAESNYCSAGIENGICPQKLSQVEELCPDPTDRENGVSPQTIHANAGNTDAASK